jgi:hypothetical protein
LPPFRRPSAAHFRIGVRLKALLGSLRSGEGELALPISNTDGPPSSGRPPRTGGIRPP